MPWLTGEIFAGHFEVGRLIARGGMAEVYHGVDLWSNNPVAIKVLFPHLATDPSQQQKFFREERSLRQISHDHVVGVIDSGTQQIRGYEMMFIVLDYVHGCTLQQLLAVRPVLSVGETLEIMIPVVEGLSEVHAHRLIHRDMKPANVLLSSAEQSVKLTDFGLTRRTDQTWTGELMGTPAYVAPEIIDPQASVGPGADIFAVGIMLFRMLTGRLPFPGMGDDQQVIYHNVNTEIPSVAQFAPGVTPDLAGVIKWCTRKQSSARPADATELFEVLQDISAQLTDTELAYRADVSSPPTETLWESVETVADRTGATKILQQTPISGFACPEEILEDSELEASHLDAAEQYLPTPIAGVGPEPAPKKNPNFEPISAEYRPKPAGSVASGQDYGQDDAAAAGAHLQEAEAADPRRPAVRWREAPSPVALILTAIILLLGFVGAGFVGWQLANSLLGSAWFEAWTSLFSAASP